MRDTDKHSRSEKYESPIASKIIELLDKWDDPSVDKTYGGILEEARQELGEHANKFIELFQDLSGEEKGRGSSRGSRKEIFALANKIEEEQGNKRRKKGAGDEVQPKNLEEFFKFYREKLAPDEQSTTESLGNYFNSLEEETQQSLLVECAVLEPFDECIATDESGKAAFSDVEVHLYLEESPEKLLPESEQESSVTFNDLMTSDTTVKTVRNKDGKYYIVGESVDDLTLNVKDQQHINYKKPGREAFLQTLHTQFKHTTYTITDAIRDKNVDYLLRKHAAELLNLAPEVLMTLNYHSKDGQFGTLLHKAIDPKNGMTQPDFYELCRIIYDNTRDTPLWNAYTNLTNEKGQTIFNLAKERRMERLPGEARVVIHIDTQSTHTTSVHKSVNQSLIRLAKKMDKDLGLHAIVGSDSISVTLSKDDPREMEFQNNANKDRLKGKLAEYFNKLKINVDWLATLDDKGLFEYLKPSLEAFEIAQGPGCKAVQELKMKLPKIKNLLADIAAHNRFHAEGSHFPINANESLGRSIDFTYKEVLALAYYSSQDESSLSGITAVTDKAAKEKAKINAELNFFDGLYDARRGYNIDDDNFDHSAPDKNRCAGGTVNSLVNSLGNCHRLVEVLKINAEAVKNEIRILIDEHLNSPIASALFIPDGLQFNLLLWQQNNSMPEALRTQFNNNFKEMIIDEIVNDYGSYLDQDPERQREIISGLYEKVIVHTKITPVLVSEIQSFDITMVPTEQLYKQLTSELRGLFVLGDKGYSIFLEHLYNKSPAKFAEVCQIAIQEKNLMSLIDNDFNNLNLLSEKGKAEFMKNLMAMGAEYLEKYTDKNDTYAIGFALDNGYLDVAALMSSLDSDPEAKKEFGQRLLIVAAGTKDIGLIEALKSFPIIDPNVPYPNIYSALMYAIESMSADAIKALRSFPGININIDADFLNRKLLEAVSKKQIDVINELLSFPGIDLNFKGENDSTALMNTVLSNDANFIRVLKNFSNIDPNIQNQHGMTALMMASIWSNSACITALKGFTNINPNIQDVDRGDTALITAAIHGSPQGIEDLMGFPNIDPNIKNLMGNTALIVATSIMNIESVRALINYPNIDPNIKNNMGDSALTKAVEVCSKLKVQLLLKSFYNIEVPHNMRLPDFGLEEDKREIASTLRSYRKDPIEWLMNNGADVELIVKCAEHKHLVLSNSQKQWIIVAAANSDRPDLIEKVMYQKYKTNRDVSYLNNQGIAMPVFACLSKPLWEVMAPSTGVNIMNKIKAAHDSAKSSTIDPETLNNSYDEAIARFNQYNQSKRQFLSLNSVEDIGTFRPLFTAALLENDHILIDRFVKHAVDNGGIAKLYADDNTLKQNVQKYADRTLSNIGKFRHDPERQIEVLEMLQQLGGGRNGSIFTKAFNTEIAAELVLVKIVFEERGTHAKKARTQSWAAPFELGSDKTSQRGTMEATEDEPVRVHTSHTEGVRASKKRSRTEEHEV